DRCSKLWEVSTGRELRKLSQDTGNPLRLALAADGRTLATCGYGMGVHLWNLARPGGPTALSTDGQARSLAFSPDGTLLPAPPGNGSVAVWGRGPKGGALAWHHRGTRVPADPVREVLFAHKAATLG